MTTEETTPKVGRPTKYDFSSLEVVGDYMTIEPIKLGYFRIRQVHTIAASLSQYKKKFAPNNIYTLKSIYDEKGRTKEVRIFLIAVA
jgi:hypothetical protein